MIRFEFSTKINFISPALRAWGWGTLLIMQWASEVAYLSSYFRFIISELIGANYITKIGSVHFYRIGY